MNDRHSLFPGPYYWALRTSFNFERKITPFLLRKMSEECPWRILNRMGEAFSIGLVYSAGVITWKGVSNRKWMKILPAIRQFAPRSALSFANLGLCFSVAECSLMAFRRQDDRINRLAAGGITGLLLSLRRGLLVSMIYSVTWLFILSIF